LVEASSSLVVGDATDPDVTVGPVISAAAKQRIEQAIATAVDDGAVLVLDGRQPRLPAKNSNGYFVGPTILKDVTPQMAIAQEEVFGPVLGLIKIRNLDEALAMIEGLRAGNGACIFTQNLYCAERFIEEADVGMIGVNVGISAPHPYMPFGGIKDSLIGNNKTQGKGAIDFFTQDKVVTVRVLCSDEGGMLDAGTDRPLLRSCTAI
jgi:malonate-semialdehyde dehydrogenase (acetylating)/methylmalonate-semialdehyde dehydrogenase